jgi:hypothetical protein
MNIALANGLVQFFEPSLVRFSRHPEILAVKNKLVQEISAIWEKVKTCFISIHSSLSASLSPYCFAAKKVHRHPFPKISPDILTGPLLNMVSLADLSGLLPFMQVSEKAQLLRERQTFVSKLLASVKLNREALSSNWKEALTLAAPFIEELDFSEEVITPHQARLLTTLFPRLKRLSLKKCTLSDSALFYLKNLPLEEIQLKECQGVSELGLSAIANIKTLKKLELPSLNLSTSFEACIQSPYESYAGTALKAYLYFSHYFFHFFFQNIKKDGSLVFQNFLDQAKTKRASVVLDSLKKLTEITHLILPESEFGFSESQITELFTLKKITHLNIECHSWPTGNTIFQHLARFNTLKEFIVSYKHNIGAEIQALKESTNLQHLALKNSQITKAGILGITKIQSLKTLDLEQSLFSETLTQEEYRALGQLPNLESLSCSISDPALFATHAQGSFLKLKTLIIRPWTNIQDQDVEMLCRLPQLENLYIQNNCGLLTKRSLQKLNECPTLKEAHLHGAIFTEDVLHQFRRIRISTRPNQV